MPDAIKMYYDPQAPAQASQYQVEFEQLLELIEEMQPRSVLEIGVLSGGSAWQFAKRVQAGGVVVGIDLPGAEWGILDAATPDMHEWGKEWGVRVIPIWENSHGIRAQQMAHVFAPYDVIFIDGDHRYEGVKADFEAYRGMARTGGVIVFHDIVRHADPAIGVWQLWAEIKTQYKHTELLSAAGQPDRGIGVLWVS